MKKTLLPILVLTATLALGQSRSYETLKDHFRGQPDVHSFSFGGWLCRAALSLAVLDEDDDIEVRLLHRAMADIDHVRFITIPKGEFKALGLSVNGFRSYLKKDSFEELANVRDDGESVTFYHKSDNGRKNQYFVLIEDHTEVVAIEMKGYIDPEIFNSNDARITFYGR